MLDACMTNQHCKGHARANYSRRSEDADDSGRVDSETIGKLSGNGTRGDFPASNCHRRGPPAWEADASSKREHLLRKQMICPLRCACGCAAVVTTNLSGC